MVKYIALFYQKIGKRTINTPIQKSKNLGNNQFEVSIETKSTNIINYEKVREKEFSLMDETIDLNKLGSSFKVYPEGYFYQDNKGNKYYAYDFDTHELLTFNKSAKFEINPKDLNKFTGRKVLESLLNQMKNGDKMSIILMIIPFVALIGGILIGHFLMPQIQFVPTTATPNVPSV